MNWRKVIDSIQAWVRQKTRTDYRIVQSTDLLNGVYVQKRVFLGNWELFYYDECGTYLPTWFLTEEKAREWCHERNYPLIDEPDCPTCGRRW